MTSCMLGMQERRERSEAVTTKTEGEANLRGSSRRQSDIIKTIIGSTLNLVETDSCREGDARWGESNNMFHTADRPD